MFSGRNAAGVLDGFRGTMFRNARSLHESDQSAFATARPAISSQVLKPPSGHISELVWSFILPKIPLTSEWQGEEGRTNDTREETT